MIDIQKEKDLRGIPLNNVGIKNFKYPIKVADKHNGYQDTIASINLYAGLEPENRAVHMSRLVQIIHEWNLPISVESIVDLLSYTKEKLEANSSVAEIAFPYFINKKAPVSKLEGKVDYYCEIRGSSSNGSMDDIVLKVHVPVCSVCPCSKAISINGAHNQRGEVIINVRFRNAVWIEDIVRVAETAASSDIFSVLKRPDEKYVTETSFNNTKFVEDIARDAATQLIEDPNITWFSVSVENYESIHSHNAYASIIKAK